MIFSLPTVKSDTTGPVLLHMVILAPTARPRWSVPQLEQRIHASLSSLKMLTYRSSIGTNRL